MSAGAIAGAAVGAAPGTARARAFWSVAPGRGEIRAETLPPLAPQHVRVRAIASAVSRGTESLVFQGRVPESERQRMRAPFQAGELPFPVKYGYAAVGTVAAAGAGAEDMIGRRVFALHPHQDLFDLPVDAAHPVPDAVPDARAALAANLETAVNALWDGAPAIGDRVAVVGLGVVGGLAASLLARIPGARVLAVDADPGRAALASALGCSFATPEEALRLPALQERDLVLHASASAAGLATALALAGFEATVLELSWHGAGDVPVPLGGAFHAKRLRLISSQVGAVAAARRARRSHADRLRLALSLLADPVYDVFLDGAVPFERLPEEMARLAAPSDPLRAAARPLARIVRYP